MGHRTSKGCFFLLVFTKTLFAFLGEKMFNLDHRTFNRDFKLTHYPLIGFWSAFLPLWRRIA